MTEFKLILNSVNIKYKGLFEYDELIHQIISWARQNGYEPKEKKAEETISAEGKNLTYEHRLTKKISTTLKLGIKIRTAINKMTETKETGAIPKIFQKGEIDMYIDAWAITNWKGKWRKTPLNFFLRAIVNKYIKKLPVEKEEEKAAADAKDLISSLKSFLNLYRYKTSRE